MNFDDPLDPSGSKRSNIFLNPGFRFGFVGGLIAIVINLFFVLINGGDNRGDLLAWIMQILIYYFIARAAAENQAQVNNRSGQFEILRGVTGAGVGAALVTSIMVWIYIIIRGVVRDSFGVFVIVEPVGLFLIILIDVLIALGLGALGGSQVARHHQD
jgi:hypothetical protein